MITSITKSLRGNLIKTNRHYEAEHLILYKIHIVLNKINNN